MTLVALEANTTVDIFHNVRASYFEEFIFRFNRRTSKARRQLFQRVLENAVRVQPAPDQDIVARQEQ